MPPTPTPQGTYTGAGKDLKAPTQGQGKTSRHLHKGRERPQGTYTRAGKDLKAPTQGQGKTSRHLHKGRERESTKLLLVYSVYKIKKKKENKVHSNRKVLLSSST